MKTRIYIFSVLAVIAVLGLVVVLNERPQVTQGSVVVGSQYQSTTTPQVADLRNLCPARVGQASSTTGVLGAINVTEGGTGNISVYDATTTNINLRTGNIATSSLLLAYIPGSPTEASYHFDVQFISGLLVDYTTTGTGVSSTTISFRCEG